MPCVKLNESLENDRDLLQGEDQNLKEEIEAQHDYKR